MRVTLTHVRKGFGAAVALADLSCEIRSRELFALVGPSGSGKTTVLRCLAGLERPDRGAIIFDDRDVTTLPPADRQVSVVFQSYALYPHLSVYENVAFGLVARAYRHAGAAGKLRLLVGPLRAAPLADEDRTRVRETLALVELEGFERRLPSELSGGQQQRVALARALVTRPRLLLLDEPLGALDARLRERMLAEIRRVHRLAGVTTVYVTHDQAEAAVVADRVGLVRDGRVEQAGMLDELRARPRSAFVAEFLGVGNVLRGAAVERDGRWWTELAGAVLVPLPHRPPSAAVTIVLYADELRLAAPDGAAGTRAVVEEARTVGSGTRYRVRAGQILLDVHPPAGTPAYAPGTHLTLVVPAASVGVLE